MIKGIRKQAVLLPLPAKSRFECAYFIVRRPTAEPDTEADRLEMLAEADRILREGGLLSRPKPERIRKRNLWRRLGMGVLLFLSGLGTGAILTLLLTGGT
ncbi:MAG: hypothetical protein IJY42_06295 [Clostridia bacterium]|nr:hypothetical protein [Clostridia bacterium]